MLEQNPKARVNVHHANFLRQWWLLSWARADMIKAIGKLTRYIACGRVTKRPIFEFISPRFTPTMPAWSFLLRMIIHSEYYNREFTGLGSWRSAPRSSPTFAIPRHRFRHLPVAAGTDLGSSRARSRSRAEASNHQKKADGRVELELARAVSIDRTTWGQPPESCPK